MRYHTTAIADQSSSFALVAPALIEMGYTPLPICPGGKAPGVYVGRFTTDDAFTYHAAAFVRQRGRQPRYGEPIIRPMPDWSTLTAADYAESSSRHESFKAWCRSPLTGVGILLGNSLVAVDVDFTDRFKVAAVAAVLDRLPGVAVRRVGKKGFAAFMRLAPGCVPPAAFHVGGQKVEFLHAGRQAVLPPSVHPDTQQPYYWTTDDTLEDTPLDALQVLDDGVLDEIRASLASFGEVSDQAAAKPRREHQGDNDNPSGFVERVNSAALAALDAWVPTLDLYGCQAKRDGFVAVAHWRSSSTGRPMEKRKQNLSITPAGVKDFGSDEGFTPVGLAMRALAIGFDDAVGWLIDRLGGPDGLGLPPLPAWSSAPPTETAEDGSGQASAVREASPHRQTLDAASEELGRLSGDFMNEHVNRQSNIATARGRAAAQDDLPAQLFKIEAGAGKTKWFAIDRVIEAVARGLKVVIAAPEHSLCAEIVEKLKLAGVWAAVYEGIERPGQCLRPKALAACLSATLSPKTTICGRYAPADNGGTYYEVTCSDAGQCGAMAQRALRPDVWVVTHASLFSARQALFADDESVDVLVIDESMVSAAIPTERKKAEDGLDLDSLCVDGVWPFPPDEVAATWTRISTALVASIGERSDDRVRHPARRSALVEAGVEIDALQAAVDWHRSELNTTTPRPGLVGAAFQAEAKRLAPIRRELRDRIELLVELQNILDDDGCELSGRVVVRTAGNRAYVHTTSLKTIHPSWRAGAAIAILDATAPAPAILEPIVGRKVEVAGEIAVEWSSDIEVVQVVGAPVRSYNLRPRTNGKVTKAHNSIVDMAKLKTIQTQGRADDDRVLFVPRKKTADLVWPLREREAGNRPPGLPTNMEIETTGRITGKNNWENVAGCIITASADGGVREFERMAGVLTGRMPERMALSEKKDFDVAAWLTENEIREIDGQLFNTAAARHPSEIVQQLHAHIVRGQYEQIAARLRPVRRDGKPGFVWIFTDWSLDIPVGRMVDWSEVDLGYAAHMLATRGVFGNGAACWAAYGGCEEFPLAEAGAVWWTSSELPKLFRPDEPSLWWSDVVAWQPGLERSDGLVPRLVRFDYQIKGSSNRDTLWFFEGTIENPIEHVAAIVRRPVVWLVDGIGRMRQQGVIWTSPVLAYAATSLTGEPDLGIPIESLLLENPNPAPLSWPSLDACKKSLQTSPPECPPGWQTFTIRLARSSKAVEAYAAPDITAGDITARAAALGYTIKEISRA